MNTSDTTCPACNGLGVVGNPLIIEPIHCPTCHGTGHTTPAATFNSESANYTSEPESKIAAKRDELMEILETLREVDSDGEELKMSRQLRAEAHAAIKQLIAKEVDEMLASIQRRHQDICGTLVPEAYGLEPRDECKYGEIIHEQRQALKQRMGE